MDPALIKQINQRVQEELRKKEIEVVQYGLTELERILGKKTPGSGRSAVGFTGVNPEVPEPSKDVRFIDISRLSS